MTLQTNVLTDIERQLAVLPPDALKLVADFVAMLSIQYSPPVQPARPAHASLSDEPYIGMWADRADMENSADYVRRLRQSEWLDAPC